MIEKTYLVNVKAHTELSGRTATVTFEPTITDITEIAQGQYQKSTCTFLEGVLELNKVMEELTKKMATLLQEKKHFKIKTSVNVYVTKNE